MNEEHNVYRLDGFCALNTHYLLLYTGKIMMASCSEHTKVTLCRFASHLVTDIHSGIHYSREKRHAVGDEKVVKAGRALTKKAQCNPIVTIYNPILLKASDEVYGVATQSISIPHPLQ